MSTTACVVPFTTIDISTDGTPLVCCQAPITLTVGGRPATMLRDPFDAIWNAPEMVDIRAAMVRGERPDACRICWEHEKTGPTSLRRLMNSAIQGQMGAQWSFDAFMRDSARDGHVLGKRPRWYQLQLGNTCNLRCRSCTPSSSSRIAADPVHRAWAANDFYGGALPAPIPRANAWYRDTAKLAQLFEDDREGHVFLSVLGGEPFLIDEVWELLRNLADRGWSRRITLGLVTNGTQRRAELEQLAPAFAAVHAGVSIDGVGALFEYLRSGAKWRDFVANVEWFQSIPNVSVSATPTLQNANALGGAQLFRFLDEHEINAHFNVVTQPRRLAPTNLPPRVRRIAAARLRDYLDDGCRAPNRPVVQSWAGLLENAGDEFDRELFAEFMKFTNELDASRHESLAAAEPELCALLRASGVGPATSARRGVTRTVSAYDAIYSVFAQGKAENYFESAMRQTGAIDALLRAHGHEGMAACRAVADYASHYGRTTRALHARAPHAVVYACDIDPLAVEFCARELGSVPVVTSWRPDEDELPRELDLVVCISLLTHTPLEHWRRTLRAWFAMLAPGGCVAFTFLSDAYVGRWLAHEMEHYGTYPDEDRVATARELDERGFAFLALPNVTFGGEPSYGIAFAKNDLVRDELAAAGFELLDLGAETETFYQELVVARRGGLRPPEPPPEVVKRDARVIALYDAGTDWNALVTAQRPLPTELGYTDARVPDVQKAQAALAREHGIDAFCYADPALSSLDFPFCLMWSNEGSFDDLVPYLRDARYVRLDERPLLVVRDVAKLVEPRKTVARWRAVAAQHGIGELHLCAVEPIPTGSLEDLGFDSSLDLPSIESPKSYAQRAASSLSRTRAFRGVLAQREPFDAHHVEQYELWLRTAIETAGNGLVFIRSWNDWTSGAYLEPDDRDGRAFLEATRRATRGPASGLVLLRRLRDSLGDVDGSAQRFLSELERVVSAHERSRDELTALVEAAYTASSDHMLGSRWVPVSPSYLPPSSGRISLDRIGKTTGAALHEPGNPVMLEGDIVKFDGWAHIDGIDPNVVDVFLVLTSAASSDERVFRVEQRMRRPDVAAAFPGYPERCGFTGLLATTELPAGTYRVGIVQRTPAAAYYDPTPVAVQRG